MAINSKTRPPFPAVLMLGAVSQIAQVLFLRELLMVFHDSELSLGIFLAAWPGPARATAFTALAVLLITGRSAGCQRESCQTA